MGVVAEDGFSRPDTWPDRHKLHIDLIDEEHRGLAGMIDEIRSAVSSGNYEAIEIQLTALLESMERHFDHEEDFMREYEYPDLRCHASVHAEFLQEGIDLLSRIVARTGLINAAFCDRLKNRLEDHVDLHDRKYVKYCLAPGAVAHSRQE